MTHPAFQDSLSAYLDGELSPSERTEIEAQLANDPQARSQLETLRELNNVLQSELVSPQLDIDQFLLRMDRLEPTQDDRIARLTKANRTKLKFRYGLAVALAVGLLVIVGLWARPVKRAENTAASASIGRIVRSVGTVEVRSKPDAPWESVSNSVPYPLDAGTTIRTSSDSLCEIVTKQAGTLRLNRDTELIMHRGDDVELVRGEFWCQAGAESVLVRATFQVGTTTANRTLPQFTCAQGSRTQCRIEQDALRFGCVSDMGMTLLLHDGNEHAISRGEWVSSSFSQPTLDRGHFDPVHDTAWQLPLLTQRPAEDSELQDFLYAMLAKLGQSKVQYLYEEQIRDLGSSGTLPLIAFVKSEKSLAEPEIRHRAMRIVADLAPESARNDLIQLTTDTDAVVAQFAKQALARLDQVQRKGKVGLGVVNGHLVRCDFLLCISVHQCLLAVFHHSLDSHFSAINPFGDTQTSLGRFSGTTETR